MDAKENYNAEDIEDWWKPANTVKTGATIGIDFGTTNSCIAYWDKNENHAEVIEFDECTTVPSAVAFQSFDHIKVGKDAIQFQDTFPSLCVTHIKRLLGRRYEDKEVTEFIHTHDFKLVPVDYIHPPSSNIHIEIQENTRVKEYDVGYICTCIFSYLKNSAETFLQEKVANCVLTVPAYFSTYQRQVLLEAANESGLNVLRLIGEPTAAALSYGLGVAGTKNIVICDFGGGTFDVSVMNITEGQFKILSIGGNNHLGGHDIDLLLYHHLLKAYNLREEISQKDHIVIMKEIERIKCELATEVSSEISTEVMEVLNRYAKRPLKTISMTQTQFNSIIQSTIQQCIHIIEETLKTSSLTKDEIQEVVLIGGSSRLVLFQSLVSNYFNHKELCKAIDPKTCVAMGAAIQAAALCGVDHDTLKHVLMLDALPYSIGIKSSDNEHCVILPRNILLPAKRTEYFYTQDDNQKYLSIEVYEGEDSVATNNKYLGTYDIPITNYQRKAGEEPIGVSLEVTIDGILKISSDHFVEQESKEQKKTFIILWLYILLLSIVFIFAKLFFNDEKALNQEL